MRSPFPGMDPYLQRYWDDVHVRLCTHISGTLQPNLPRGLRARAAQRIKLEEPDPEPGPGQRFEGDTVLVATGPAGRAAAGAGAALATVDPVVIEWEPDVQRERWVQIIDAARGDRVVTVIEILSPGNKLAGDLNKRYRRKLKQYVRAGVNLVEIDLIRSTRGRLRVKAADIPPHRRAAYYTCVHRATDPGRWEAYPMPLRDPLPTVPIPCRADDPEVALVLQPILDRIYVEGGHDDIDYSVPPEPPLSAADAAWAAGLTAGRTGEV